MLVTLLVATTITALASYLATMWWPNQTFEPRLGPYSLWIAPPLLGTVSMVIVFLQFRFRLVWFSRAMLAGLPVLTLVAMLLPQFEVMTMKLLYRSDREEIPLHIAARSDLPKQENTLEQQMAYSYGDQLVWISVPIDVSGVPPGDFVVADGLSADVIAPDGSHSTSPWRFSISRSFHPGTQHSNVYFSVDPAFFRRFRTSPLSFHVSMAVTQLAADQPITYSVQPKEMSLKNFGLCSFNQEDHQVASTTGRLFAPAMSCMTAMRDSPPYTLLTTQWSRERCASPDEPELSFRTAWDGADDRHVADLNLIALFHHKLFFYASEEEEVAGDGDHMRPFLCPDTQLTETTYHAARRTSIAFELRDIILADLSVGNPYRPTM